MVGLHKGWESIWVRSENDHVVNQIKWFEDKNKFS